MPRLRGCFSCPAVGSTRPLPPGALAQHPLSPSPLAPSLQLEETLELPSSQALALFNKAIRRLHGLLRAAKEAEVRRLTLLTLCTLWAPWSACPGPNILLT